MKTLTFLFLSVSLGLGHLSFAQNSALYFKYLENIQGQALQTSDFHKTNKSATCRIFISEHALTLGTFFIVRPENENQPAISNQTFVFDTQTVIEESTASRFKAERQFSTPESFCANSSTGEFYPARSPKTVQTLIIENNKAEITETYKCGLFFPTRVMANRTVCEF